MLVRPALVLFCVLSMLANSALAAENLVIRYLTPLNDAQAEIKTTLEHSGVNEILIELSNELFPFDKTLVIEYGSEEGPLYDPEKHVIQVPYQFYQQALEYFKSNQYDKKYGKSADLGALDTMLHTLLHEAGHAYIADQEIPILGKEEDAVDNFAAVIMIEYLENGDDSAISAADMFAFESEDRPDFYDFGEYIDEHSFDLQRYFSTLCLVYGSDPKKHQSLLDEVESDYLAEREEFCEFNYQNVAHNWHTYLGN